MSSDVRAAILTPFGPSRPIGGVEVFNESLRRVLGNVETFADGSHNPNERFPSLGRVGLEQPAGALRAARALLSRHREEPFDVIVSNGVYGWPLTLARPGVPLVQVYHFTMAGLARRALTLPGDRLTTGHVTALFDRIAGIGKHVVAISQFVMRDVESFYGLKARLIPHAVDTDVFRPMNAASARGALGLPQGVPIGLFVGRADPTKGYDVLQRVARRMPHVLFLVAGEDAGKSRNVWSVGRIPHEDMRRWYAASDFFFLPSRYEGFGLALLEALSCDLPAVVSEPAWPFADGPAECGVVVRAESDEAFANAIRTVLASRRRFSPRAFVLPRYNLPAFERAWRGFLESVLNAGG